MGVVDNAGRSATDFDVPDTDDVLNVLGSRFLRFVSLLLGSPERVSEYLEIDTSEGLSESRAIFEAVIRNYPDIRRRTGWHNDHFLAFLIMVKSWMDGTCSKDETLESVKAIKSILERTNTDSEESSLETMMLETTIACLLDSTC